MRKEDTPPTWDPRLTRREEEVLELLSAGKSNPVIAQELTLVPRTVENYINSIFKKLGVNNEGLDARVAAARWRWFKLGPRE